MKSLRALPAVEKVLQALGPVALPRPFVLKAVRDEIAALRKERDIPAFDGVLASVRGRIKNLRRTRIQPVINATGIVIHTNLGRSPLGTGVIETLQSIGSQYNNLEFDLTTGERGGRAAYLEQALALASGAEAATVTNNCAAALVLMLRYFTRDKKDVVISRGELVQIGGGFRIPEILEASGARLREVGATNKTSLTDYSRAMGRETGLILKVHRSNFFMGGFVDGPSTEELAALARKKRVPFVEDLGSGALAHTEKLNRLEHEPTPAEVLKKGVDLVCYSGDKLLGGPQSGIIAGKARLISVLKREPFFRALRCDKLILSALQTTVEAYLEDRAMSDVPTLALLRLPDEELRKRAEAIVAALVRCPVKAKVGASESQVGGGTLPQSVVPSVTVDLLPQGISVKELATRLRLGSSPVVGTISGGWLRLNLRTVFPEQDAALITAVASASQARA